MKFNLTTGPDPIVLDPNGDGDVITIQHERLTATERAEALELAETSMAASMRYLYDKYLAWDGVTDMNGRAIPPQYMDGREQKSNVDDVFGLLGLAVAMEAWIKQMVLNGVEFKRIEQAARQNMSDREFEKLREAAERMGKLPAPTDGESSTS